MTHDTFSAPPGLAVLRSPGARALASYLQDEIRSGRLTPGVKLPGERELSERFGTSRGSVRRVLGELREQGWVTQAVGSGTFAARPATHQDSSAPAGLRLSGHTSPAELMEARMLIEPLMPALIARNATSADFARMQTCLEHSEAAASVEDFEYWDGQLHLALAQATHNQFFAEITALVNHVRDQGDWGRLKRNSLTPERRAQYQAQHRAIVAALQDRDAGQARSQLYEHLEQIQRNLFEPPVAG